jgi:hypothetical protein
MQSHPEDRIDSIPEPSPMAIAGAILAQRTIRHLDRQKNEQRATDKSNRITEQHKGFSLENSANGM